VCCGHCVNRNNKNRHKKRFDSLDVCELWENIEIKKEERKRAIKETLEWMADKLEEITMILKDDKE